MSPPLGPVYTRPFFSPFLGRGGSKANNQAEKKNPPVRILNPSQPCKFLLYLTHPSLCPPNRKRYTSIQQFVPPPFFLKKKKKKKTLCYHWSVLISPCVRKKGRGIPLCCIPRELVDLITHHPSSWTQHDRSLIRLKHSRQSAWMNWWSWVLHTNYEAGYTGWGVKLTGKWVCEVMMDDRDLILIVSVTIMSNIPGSQVVYVEKGRQIWELIDVGLVFKKEWCV